MSTLFCLSMLLLICMLLVGGRKGLRSFIALFINFGILFISILFMADPTVNPVIITFIGSVLISCVSLFYINGMNVKTKTALLATGIVFVILLVCIVAFTDRFMIKGFGEEEVAELSMFSLFVGVDFSKIAVSVIIMSTIGAIVDLAISIASPLREIYTQSPALSRKDLYQSGLGIGRDILGTTTNTLFFAFFGSYLGLFIWFKDATYSLGEIINSKVFSGEMLTILFAGTAVTLTIPVTSWVTAYFLTKK
ncbi:YibE/F family protein [Ectobacillus sp. JY-23]|uniref:YibE/F family protein n=1 Tax=Ectobacillus sp. JY-23 TaxID=2933872 RepID=UPI001FF18FD2|nr:YibE/F family protein [Ectobacillus sp. JY-23]UOY92260.1 YibE/F family protein [Ectobacillus sp. JY-23]